MEPQVKMNQMVARDAIQARWSPIIMVGISGEGDEEVRVEPMPDGTALLRVGVSAVKCKNVRQALCCATGWVMGRIAVVGSPVDEG